MINLKDPSLLRQAALVGTRWIEADGAIVCEIRFTGRLHTGRPIAFDALDVFDLRDGRITKVATWYDTRALARQIRG